MAVSAQPQPASLPLEGGREGATVRVHPMVVAEMKAPPNYWERGGPQALAMVRALATPARAG